MSHVNVIAEAGVNHNGHLDLALEMVDVAAACGVDAVKFQAFRADRLATQSAPLADYQKRGGGADGQREMLRQLELSGEGYAALAHRCREKGVEFLCSVFDEQSADAVAPFVIRYKIPSGELTNHRLLRHVAGFGKPLIVSTGMATLADIERALGVITACGPVAVTLLHCTSLYPTPASAVNLRAMDTLAAAFGVPVGYSDHTEGIAISLAAVARGATVVEKHFTTDRSLPGPDHAASIEPDELAAMVAGIRAIEQALGDGRKSLAPGEETMARVARRSVAVLRDLPAGAVLTHAVLDTRRPGTGIPAEHLEEVAGRRLRRGVAAGTILTWEDV